MESKLHEREIRFLKYSSKHQKNIKKSARIPKSSHECQKNTARISKKRPHECQKKTARYQKKTSQA